MYVNEVDHVAEARRFFDEGDLQSSEQILRRVLEREPSLPDARLLLGILSVRTGRIGEGEQLLESVIELFPHSFDALSWMAVGKQLKKEYGLAADFYERAIALRQDDATALSHLGTCLLKQRKFGESAESFARAIQLQPDQAPGYFNLGLALKGNGSSMEAFHAFRQAIQLDPDYLPGYSQLFDQLQHLLNWDDGLELLRHGHLRNPEAVSVAVALAVVSGKLGLLSDAEVIFRKAVKLDPIAGPPFAHWLHEQGRFREAERVLTTSITADPTLGEAYHNLAVARCFAVDSRPLADVAKDVLDRKDLRPKARMFLYYAAAKSFEAEKNFEIAMEYFDLANSAAYAIYNRHVTCRPEVLATAFEKKKTSYSRERLEKLRQFGSQSETPIFIVGMIRSGTTLLDQILSSHRNIESAGELPFWGITSQRLEQKWEATGEAPEDFKKSASKYLEALKGRGRSDLRIIDKMPVNYHGLGLIQSVFPKARIIHLRRSPMDTCVSIYTTFLGDATYFAYNRENIVETYLDYLKKMQYWRSVLTKDRFVEIDYEELVTRPEPVLRSLVDFCGLDWDAACLYPELNQGQVSTPSLFTVRQPINSGSIDRWRRYEPWLGSLNELQTASHPANAPSRGGNRTITKENPYEKL